MTTVFDLAYGRAGDKGNIANISVIARTPEAYALLKRWLTAERVAEHVRPLTTGRVVRYELDNIEALNFVLYDALDGGATRSLRIDPLGKSLAGLILMMEVDEAK
ncbi:MAG: AtuA-related protein [Candidatus Flexifilum sp.]